MRWLISGVCLLQFTKQQLIRAHHNQRGFIPGTSQSLLKHVHCQKTSISNSFISIPLTHLALLTSIKYCLQLSRTNNFTCLTSRKCHYDGTKLHLIHSIHATLIKKQKQISMNYSVPNILLLLLYGDQCHCCNHGSALTSRYTQVIVLKPFRTIT